MMIQKSRTVADIGTRKFFINIFVLAYYISKKVYICRLIKINRKELITPSVSGRYHERMVYENALKTSIY